MLKRINELAHKNKEGKLTEQEIKERKKLREEYMENFRAGFKQKIEMTKLFDKQGKEITSHKVREIQKEKGLRDD